jgi:serine/threonine protein kinase
METDAAAIWDSWCKARSNEPLLDAAEFARRYGDQSERILEELGLAMLMEELRPAPLPLDPGTDGKLRFGPYEVEREIGRGGFGIVFDARDEAGQHVALKVVNPLLLVDGERQEALLEEARVLNTLHHPGIVRLEGCGRERGYTWFAMELVDGVRLDHLATLRPAAGAKRAIELGVQLAQALEAAHRAGVVHRDLKPSNVLVDAAGQVRILDFGLALRDVVSVSVSHSAKGAGTPAFMAPEQLTPGGRISPRTDLHAVGYLLLLLARPSAGIEMLTSQRLTRRRLGEPRGLPASCLRGIPRNLRSVILRCLEIRPSDRYPSAAALTEDLCALHNGRSLPHGRPGPLRRCVRWTLRNPVRPLLAGVVALVFSQGWRLWIWDPLVPIRIDSHLSGKRLLLDGEELGITPLTLYLRSGDYTWRLQYGGSSEPVYSGKLRVERGQEAAHLWALNPAATANWADPTPYDEVPAGAGAWVRIAVRELDTGGPVTLSGAPNQEDLEVTDYVHLRLPFGEHRLTLSAPNFRPKTRVLSITDETMHFWSAELDRTTSDWTTTTVYGPLEDLVGTPVEEENLRVYVESEPNLDTLKHRYIRYFGPLGSDHEARVGFWVDLPGPVADLEVSTSLKPDVNIQSASWVRLELGPSPDSAFPVAGFHGKGIADEPAVAGLPASPRATPQERKLVALMQGRERLFVRFVIGPTLAGDAYAYGQALRAESGPEGADWSPAIRLRMRMLSTE